MDIKNDPIKLFLRLSCVAVLLVGVLAVPQGGTRAATTFTVDSWADAVDSNPGDGSCYNGIDGCSLRAAIQEAFYWGSSGNPVTIHFSVTGTLTLNLGTLNWAGDYITVDGGTNNIILSGAGLSAGQSIFQISGSRNLLEGLSVRGSKGDGVQVGDYGIRGKGNNNSLNGLKIYGSTYSGVHIESSSSGGGNYNQIWNSLIGSSNYSTCLPDEKNGMDGITLDPELTQTLITNNTIVCNGFDGIYLGGPEHSTTIQNNFIGTDGIHSGLGNSWTGIEATADSNTSITYNVISGNTDWGILLEGSSGAGIYSNKIGTNTAGNAAIPNGKDGIRIGFNSTTTNVGSATDITKRNIISGNGMNGALITGGAHSNVLDGNYIGLGADGSAPIPNGYAGVAIVSADNNVLSAYGESVIPQFISSNSREGVYVTNSDGTVINAKTFIGVAADMAIARGNGLEGVKLDNGSTDSVISPGKVMYNGGTGIAVIGDTSIGNLITPINIGYNGGLAIDLGNDGFTYIGSHSPPGPNNWINHPIVNMLGSGSFSGITYAGAIVYFYRAIGDPGAAQGGGTFLSSITADGVTGDFNFTFPIGVAAVTMVACDGFNNCSEMSPKVINSFSYIFLPLLKR